MPKVNVILNLPGFTVQNINGHSPIVFNLMYRRQAICPHCGSKNLRKKDSFTRRVWHEMLGLSRSYKSFAKQHFPQAMIVADRFHVIRQLLHQCMLTYQQIDPSLKYQRGLLSALRTNPEKLSQQQLERRNDYFIRQPAIEAVYHFKQRLHQLLMYKHCTAKKCRRLIPIFLRRIEQLKASPFQPLKTLGKTFYQWREEIVRMWRFTKSNGITEGFHRKMKLIQRRAYGFKNFDNYRLRVRVLCS